MKHEFSPWRSEYFGRVKCECPFCEIAQKRLINSEVGEFETADEGNFVLFRAKHSFCVMNRYPYTLGEFMLVPFAHAAGLDEVSGEAWSEMSALTPLCVSVLQKTLNAGGVNVGINIGEASGAGIAEHLHIHFVPRWSGDTNFITTIAHTRIHGVPFFEQFSKLKEAFRARLGEFAKTEFEL